MKSCFRVASISERDGWRSLGVLSYDNRLPGGRMVLCRSCKNRRVSAQESIKSEARRLKNGHRILVLEVVYKLFRYCCVIAGVKSDGTKR